jgi:hypothetical protein
VALGLLPAIILVGFIGIVDLGRSVFNSLLLDLCFVGGLLLISIEMSFVGYVVVDGVNV